MSFLYNDWVSDSPLLLCIDFGLAKVGVAVGSMLPSTPLEVMRYSSHEQLIEGLAKVVAVERPEGVVIGWPAEHLTISTPQTEIIFKFGEEIGGLWQLPVVYYPETLTTQLAQRRMIAAGISKQRRRLLEDGYAAAVILDDYLQQLN
jgi:putative Holliday junction resolvase